MTHTPRPDDDWYDEWLDLQADRAQHHQLLEEMETEWHRKHDHVEPLPTGAPDKEPF